MWFYDVCYSYPTFDIYIVWSLVLLVAGSDLEALCDVSCSTRQKVSGVVVAGWTAVSYSMRSVH